MFILAGKSSNKDLLSLFGNPMLAKIFDPGLEQMTSPRPGSPKAILFESKRQEIAHPRIRKSFIWSCLHTPKFLNYTSNKFCVRCLLSELHDITCVRIVHIRLSYYEFFDHNSLEMIYTKSYIIVY